MSGTGLSDARPCQPGPGPRGVPRIVDLIGNTPMVELSCVRGRVPAGVRILGKVEGFNPGGSVKARAAWNMVRRGLASGQLRPGKIILDSTSGNTGIALAMLGAALGYPVSLVMPENVSLERKRVLAAYGANIVYSSPFEGSDGAILLCRELLAQDPDRYFKPDQYNNEANAEAHYLTTGPEIWRQTGGKVTHLVATIGTSGTVMGTGRFLKESNPSVQIVAAEPEDAFHGIEGLKHMASSIVPGIWHREQVDRVIGVETEASYDMVYQIAAGDGLLLGQSSGAAVLAAIEIAQELKEGCIAAILPDFGDRYLSTNLWLGWRDRHQLASSN
ncbi:MAG TPA: cysteine synthase [Candidatus Binatia bacterium]|nr:cysteine synthase [Candidatus Binatia bacterium]